MNINQKIQKYKELKEQMKQMEKEVETIGSELKAIGSFETDVFCVKITVQSKEFLKGIKDVSSVFGREELEKNNLIGTTSYEVIRVSEKA